MTIKSETSIQTSDPALTADLKSHGIPYQAIPTILSDHRVEVQFVFPKTAEVERLVEEFKNNVSLHKFLQASREVKDVMMQLVRTLNGNKKPNPLTPKRKSI